MNGSEGSLGRPELPAPFKTGPDDECY